MIKYLGATADFDETGEKKALLSMRDIEVKQ